MPGAGRVHTRQMGPGAAAPAGSCGYRSQAAKPVRVRTRTHRQARAGTAVPAGSGCQASQAALPATTQAPLESPTDSVRRSPQNQLLQQHQGALQHVQAQHAAPSLTPEVQRCSPGRMQHLRGEAVGTTPRRSHLWELHRQPACQRQAGGAASGGSLCCQADGAAVSQVWLQASSQAWQTQLVGGGGPAAHGSRLP